MENEFVAAKRQKFRNDFQPSRIVVLSIFDDATDRFNIATLCFSMHSAYKPPSIAFAVEKRHLSHELLSRRSEFVLAVPGRDLAQATLLSGLVSGRSTDKVREAGVRMQCGGSAGLGLLSDAVANIECQLAWVHDAGDHSLFNARVLRYLVTRRAAGAGLLSIGTDEAGYEVLCTSGVHKIAVPMSAK